MTLNMFAVIHYEKDNMPLARDWYLIDILKIFHFEYCLVGLYLSNLKICFSLKLVYFFLLFCLFVMWIFMVEQSTNCYGFEIQHYQNIVYYHVRDLGVIHKCISSKIADFFRYYLNPWTILSGLAKKFSKVSFSNTQYEKCLNTKSSLMQIQDAHFHWSFN